MKSHLQSANEKSFLPYRQKKGKLLSLYKETFPLLLKEPKRRSPLAPSSSLDLGFGFELEFEFEFGK